MIRLLALNDRVPSPVGIQAGNVVGGVRTIVLGKLAAYEYFAVGLRQDTPDRAICSGSRIERGVQCAIQVEAGNPVAPDTVIRGKAAANNDAGLDIIADHNGEGANKLAGGRHRNAGTNPA